MEYNLGKVLLTPKGDYNNDTTYEVLDIVSYNGSSFAAKQSTQGHTPTGLSNDPYWQLMAIAAQGGTTDVKINNTSITDNNVANIVTKSAYNETTNRIATENDIPEISTNITSDATSDTKTTSPNAVKTFVEGKGYTTNQGTVTGVTVGSTAYTPTNGVVTIPEYPDVSSKIDKVDNPTAGNFAVLTSKGFIADSNLDKFSFASAEQGTKADNAIPMPSNGSIGQVLKKTSTSVKWEDEKVSDVKINDTSITSRYVANIVTNGVYDDTTNPLATMSDIPDTSGFASKVSSPTTGDLAALDSNGDLTDSGISGTSVSSAVTDAHTHSNKTILDKMPSSIGTAGQAVVVNSGATGLEFTDIPVTDVTVDGTSVLNNGVAEVPAIPTISNDIAADKTSTTKAASPSAVYNEVHPEIASTIPAGGILPNVLYDLGTLTGNITISFATPTDLTKTNLYCIIFECGATAYTVTFNTLANNTAIIWTNQAPLVTANKKYEISIMYSNAIGIALEV